MQQILVVEDDKPLAQLLKRVLEEAGYAVTLAHDVASVKRIAEQSYTPELILCDIMLPDGDGLSLSEFLQQAFSCPFIYLTALDSDDSQISGLNLGASDYLIKPVKPAVLLARVKANLRKSELQTPLLKQFEQLRLDPRRKEAYYDCTNLTVSPDEFRILELMLDNDPEPVSRDALFADIVGREYDGMDRAIDLKVSRLRKKLAANETLLDIKSIRGKGYALTLVEA